MIEQRANQHLVEMIVIKSGMIEFGVGCPLELVVMIPQTQRMYHLLMVVVQRKFVKLLVNCQASINPFIQILFILIEFLLFIIIGCYYNISI